MPAFALALLVADYRFDVLEIACFLRVFEPFNCIALKATIVAICAFFGFGVVAYLLELDR